jgi:AraC-like DNA-binding protein/mannose-6-phosphate isomerase-like protein (cupin superfamily)
MSNLTEKQIIDSISNSNINFSLDVFRVISFKSGYRFKMHNHKRIELNYILQGSCVMMLENELIKLSRNNSILIFPDSNHDFFVDSKQGIKIVQLEFQMDEQIFTAFKDVLETELSFLYNLKSKPNSYFKIPNNPEIGDCMERIIKESKLQRNNIKPLSKLYFLELIILLSRYINRQITITGKMENEYLKKAMGIIHANYCSGFSISEIAKECNISTRYLRKLFEINLESTPLEYCNNLKIKKATELLADRIIPIKEIAYTVGYSTPQYFSRAFKVKYGFSPQTYRNILFKS